MEGASANSESTAIVPILAPKRRAEFAFCRKPLLLPFGKATFYVPEEAVISVPKGTNRVENATVLNQIIGTKSPAAWHNYMDPDRLILIKGSEGTSVYTTFKVMDQTTHEEEVFIRHIPPTVCEKQFPKWKERIDDEVAEGIRKPPENDRQEGRLKVLDWTGKDCKRAQVNPENNNWEICKEPPKSLKTAVSSAVTGGKRTGAARARAAGASGSVDDGDLKIFRSEEGDEVVKTYRICVGKDYIGPKLVDGFLYLTTVKSFHCAAEESMAAEGEE